MLGTNFRPWGLLSWVLPKIEEPDWSILGSISTEERCLAVFQALSQERRLQKAMMFSIFDPPSTEENKIKAKVSQNIDKFEANGGSINDINEFALEAPAAEYIIPTMNYLTSVGRNLIIDISSLPKRFFFSILKKAIETIAIENLIVTYTIPREYFKGDLASNIGHWKHLPSFGSHSSPFSKSVVQKGVVVVGIGFQSLGLPNILKDDHKDDDIRVLFPFPSGEHFNPRNLDVIIQLQKSIERDIKTYYVNGRDVSEIYDLLCAKLNPQKERIIFAPYGPKPMSLAMCLYASRFSSEVLYTQPKFYHPDYSTGISYTEGKIESYAYCLRLKGINLY